MGYWRSRNRSLRMRPTEGSRRSSTSRKVGDKFPWQLSKQFEPLSSKPESNSSTKTGAEKAFGYENRGMQGESSPVAFSRARTNVGLGARSRRRAG